VEGHCEYRLVWWLIHSYYPHVKICKSESDFVNGINGKNIYYITDCENGDKIPYAINDSYYKLKKAGLCDVVIVCDLERMKCSTQRKSLILKRLDSEVDTSLVKFVFSKPLLEEIYCFETCKTVEILKSHYKLRNNAVLDSNIDLSVLTDQGGSPLHRMRVFYQVYGLTFKKTEFADKFFSQFDFKSSKNSTVQRMLRFTDDNFNDF
jgi:hypothetical protein